MNRMQLSNLRGDSLGTVLGSTLPDYSRQVGCFPGVLFSPSQMAVQETPSNPSPRSCSGSAAKVAQTPASGVTLGAPSAEREGKSFLLVQLNFSLIRNY